MEFLVVPKVQEVLNNNNKKTIMLKMSMDMEANWKRLQFPNVKQLKQNNKVGLDYVF